MDITDVIKQNYHSPTSAELIAHLNFLLPDVKVINKKQLAEILGSSNKEISPVLQWYINLYAQFGDPGPWPWFGHDQPHTAEEIIIGSILTQNTNWRNVDKALTNLRAEQVNSIKKIYQVGQKNLAHFKELVRPSGFYNQKAERLFDLSKEIIEGYDSVQKFFSLPLTILREKLLFQKGIGQETADCILLYAANKPSFVVDAYTRKFLKSKQQSSLAENNYHEIQKYFIANLPLNVRLFQNYHALIIFAGKQNATIIK